MAPSKNTILRPQIASLLLFRFSIQLSVIGSSVPHLTVAELSSVPHPLLVLGTQQPFFSSS
jgi:hypothetical protein